LRLKLILGFYAETPLAEASCLLDHTLPFVQHVNLEYTHAHIKYPSLSWHR